MRYVAVQFTSGGLTGHRFKDQIAARIASHLYDLTYAHTPFPHDFWEEHRWEPVLGFGVGEVQLSDLNLNELKVVHIRQTAWFGLDLSVVKAIIDAHPEDNTIFIFSESARIIFEQLSKNDRDHVSNIIREKYTQNRINNPISEYFDKDKLTVAMHIRRGPDVNPKHPKCRAPWRYTDNDYYLNVMNNIQGALPNSDIVFHIYSQGDLEEFDEFKKYNNVKIHLCYLPYAGDVDTYNKLFISFHHMAIADIYVTGISEFSYFLAHMNKNCIIFLRDEVPAFLNVGKGSVLPFPDNEDRFIETDNQGNFSFNKLQKYISNV